jgi:hypothetical protein
MAMPLHHQRPRQQGRVSETDTHIWRIDRVSIPAPQMLRYQFALTRAIVRAMQIEGTALHRRRSWRFLLGVLCIGLVILGSTVAVSHSHSPSGPAHADCALCVTAHIVVQPVAAYIAIDVAQVFAPVLVPLSSAPCQNISPFSLFTRPPPVDVVLG